MANNIFKILVVEDELSLMNLIVKKLEKEGYDILTADNGEDGLEIIKNQDPDLILLDIIMPKMNGYEVLNEMKAENINIPVIIISNSGQAVEIDRAKKLGAVDFLVKTEFEPAEVLEKVKNYLDNHRSVLSEENFVKPREDEGVCKLNLKVLLVEDDPFLREICGKKLAKEGYTVYESADGHQALDVFSKVSPDIVLLDIILPNLNGFQILKKIRADKNFELAQVPVIMLSNLGQEEDVKKAMALGANDYLVKAHFTTDEIAARIKSILKK